MHAIGENPMMRSRGEREAQFIQAFPAATMALLAAPAKHTVTTNRKLPSVPAPCNPGSHRPLLKRTSSQAVKKNNHAAEQHRITTRPGGAGCRGEFVIGGGLLNAQATDDGGAPAEPAFRDEAFPSATTASLSFGRANHSAAQTST